MENIRNEIVSSLNFFYESEGIVPTAMFNCRFKYDCNRRYSIQTPTEHLAQGMQCHVGTKYGEHKIKALVVSLDCGWGGAENMEERTLDVEKGSNNPQMKGTLKCISNLLFRTDDNKESLKYYAMTNSCKCSRPDSPDQLPDFLYEQCIPFKKQEIEILNPNVIFFQGKKALLGIEFYDIDNQSNDIFEYLKFIKVNDKMIFAVKCIHPSARGRHASRKNTFYNQLLPKINQFLREQLN